VATLNAYMVGMRADKQLRPPQARTVEEGHFKMYLYPQRKLTPDVIYDTLQQTTCVAPTGYGVNGRTVVRVGMFTWTPYRDIDDQLIRLHRAGCDVQVIVSLPTIDKAVMKHLLRAKVPVWNALYNRGHKFYYIHDKNLIIDGMVGGLPLSQVQTGSNNFTDGGLIRNTESIIRIRNQDVTNRFIANWTLIRGYSKPVTKVSQLGAMSAAPVDPDNMEPAGR
jgi:phosphatidylserine/phosphatidylglycerophosphate/cardiolipin synthase-like enzyme